MNNNTIIRRRPQLPVDDPNQIIIPDHFVPILELDSDKNQLYVYNGTDKVHAKQLAVFTNKGIVLERGGINHDGTYYATDMDLPSNGYSCTNSPGCSHPKNGFVKAFKELYGNKQMGNYPSMDGFEDNFNLIMDERYIESAWRDIDNKLRDTSPGQQLVNYFDFKVLALVNINNRKLGVSVRNHESSSWIGRNGTVYLNGNSLVFVNNKTKLVLT